MQTCSSHTNRNLLLRALAPDDAARLAPHLEPVELPRRLILERSHRPVEHIYFPDTGIASNVIEADRDRDRRVEVGLFGHEGMSGVVVVLGNDRSPQECFMQIGGAGRRITADALRKAMTASISLHKSLLLYAQSLLSQTAFTALANARGRIDERLCRWLLMCHDRVAGDQVALTHEFLATMLGVRRAGVTNAMHLIEGRGLIHARRGSITILDRAGLETCANGMYGVPEEYYQRLVGVSLRAA